LSSNEEGHSMAEMLSNGTAWESLLCRSMDENEACSNVKANGVADMREFEWPAV